MGVLSELIKITNVKDISETIKALGAANKSNKKRYSSITRMSNEGTLQFPTLVSTSLDIETLQMVTKALERNYSSVVQTVISLNPTLNIADGEGPVEYLKQFHQNSDIKGASSNIIDTIDNLPIDTRKFESYTNIGNDTIQILAKTYEVSYPPLIADNKEQCVDLMDDVRDDVLNRKYAPSRESLYKFSDPKLTAKYNSIINESGITYDRFLCDKYTYDPAYEIPMNDPRYIEYRNAWLDTSRDLRDLKDMERRQELKRNQNVPSDYSTEGAIVSDRDPSYDMPIGDPDYLETRNKWLSSKPYECEDCVDERSVQYEPEPSYTMPMNDLDYLEARDEWLNDDVVTEAKGKGKGKNNNNDALKYQRSRDLELYKSDLTSGRDATKYQYDLNRDNTKRQHELDIKDADRRHDRERDSARYQHDINRDRVKRRHERNIKNDDRIHDREMERVKFGNTREIEDIKHSHSILREPMFKDMLVDNDVKKANELVPTLLHVKLRLVNNDENVGISDFIVGIKALMHPIKSEEFVSNVVEACRNNNKVFNFLRWTTGEISFFKDFLFGINQTKSDIKRSSKGSSSWWLALKNRKSLASIKNTSTFTKNRMLPNCTLVMSIEEADFIKSAYGFDLFKPIFIDKIMRELFLLGFVIVDNSSQVVHFLFDGQKYYQSVTFGSLERENNNDSRKFKEMLKTINRL